MRLLLLIRITSLSMYKRTSPNANTITIYTNSQLAQYLPAFAVILLTDGGI